MMRFFSTCILAITLLGAAAAGAQDWPSWRGPHHNGSSDAAGLPVKFGPTEGVKWSVELPGPGAATPVIWGDSVFISSTDVKAENLAAICIDCGTGKIRWKQVAGSGYRPAGMGSTLQLDYRTTYASASPVTDGKRVIFYYGNGDLAAFDFMGQRLWARNIQKDYGDFCFFWTYSCSPLLYEGRLYIQVLQRDLAVSGRGKDGAESFLLALDPATGREHWKVVRPSPARMESREAFSTPIPFEHKGRKEILLAGADLLTAHDPATGKELWRWGTWNPGFNHSSMRLIPSPVAGGGVVLGCGPKREPVYAVKAGGSGDISATGLAWKSEERSAVTTDVPTPLFYRRRFYVLSDVRKAISCVEPADGKVVWSTPLPGPAMCWASPTGADGKIYLLSLTGQVHVLDAEKGELLATNPMAEQETEIRSTIAAAHGCLFIRTNTRLYCIGK
jgi:outer membrane protein assembly factor BamB